MISFRIFGKTLISDFGFANPVLPGVGPADLCFEVVAQAPFTFSPGKLTPSFVSPNRNEGGESVLHLYRIPECDVLHCPTVADFFVWSELIVCHPLSAGQEALTEIRFLGVVLSYWLEKQGIVTLHAAAVCTEQGAAVFLSSNRGGKSSLAAALVQRGLALLSDDILPLYGQGDHLLGAPGYPAMRFWPAAAQHFCGEWQNLPRVHPALEKRRLAIGEGKWGRFCPAAQPVRCIYLPEREEDFVKSGTIEMSPIPPAEALMTLIQHSFSAHLIEAAGLAPQRLERLAEIAGQIPLRRLAYPAGYVHLPAVCEAILADLAA